MKSLILIAHGSRREASNEEVRGLARCLAARAGEGFDQVFCAFLELAEPSIPEGIERAVGAGARQVTLLPYFLCAGRHVAEDIPSLVDRKRREHPRVDIRLTPHLGAAPAIAEVLLGLARDH
jgi:sirohydrochlorin ferrochelatase